MRRLDRITLALFMGFLVVWSLYLMEWTSYYISSILIMATGFLLFYCIAFRKIILANIEKRKRQREEAGMRRNVLWRDTLNPWNAIRNKMNAHLKRLLAAFILLLITLIVEFFTINVWKDFFRTGTLGNFFLIIIFGLPIFLFVYIGIRTIHLVMFFVEVKMNEHEIRSHLGFKLCEEGLLVEAELVPWDNIMYITKPRKVNIRGLRSDFSRTEIRIIPKRDFNTLTEPMMILELEDAEGFQKAMKKAGKSYLLRKSYMEE